MSSNANGITLDEFVEMVPLWETSESSHHTIVGDGGHAYGLYQITESMVEDFNRITNSKVNHVVAFDPVFSARICKTVLEHYSRAILRAGYKPTLKHWLFIWNGGGGAWRRVHHPIQDQKQVNLERYAHRATTIINQHYEQKKRR